jgi:CRISPR-associated endoribonuclease Cas6
MLFRKQGRMERGFDFPGPWVMLLDVSGRDLIVTLRLFGFAGDYAAPAAEALVTAIRTRLDLPGKSGLFVPDRRVTGRRVDARSQIQVQQGVTEAELEFLTPVALSGTSPLEYPASLISTMAFRAAGLARWHDSRLTVDRPQLHEMIDAVRFEWNGAQGVSWQRGSSRQGKAIPMSGYVGRLSVFGSPEAMNCLLPILAVGEEAFIGADVAFGCGRFVLNRGKCD